MPQPRSTPARFSVRFDDTAFLEDLDHASPSGREVAQSARARREREGADPSELAPCDADHSSGTQLANCVKVYLPTPGGRWRMVFELVRDPITTEIVLAYRAFGVGHPEHPWQPSAYQVAHWRLHASQ